MAFFALNAAIYVLSNVVLIQCALKLNCRDVRCGCDVLIYDTELFKLYFNATHCLYLLLIHGTTSYLERELIKNFRFSNWNPHPIFNTSENVYMILIINMMQFVKFLHIGRQTSTVFSIFFTFCWIVQMDIINEGR